MEYSGYSGKHIGDPILKTIIEMASEMSMIQKRDMEKYIRDRQTGRVYFIKKPDGNVLTFNERKIGGFLNSGYLMLYFTIFLEMNVKRGYHLVDQEGNILNWDSFETLIPGVLYNVVKKK
jgi:hypothetical protein